MKVAALVISLMLANFGMWAFTSGHAYNNPHCMVQSSWRGEVYGEFCMIFGNMLPVGWPFYWSAELQRR